MTKKNTRANFQPADHLPLLLLSLIEGYGASRLDAETFEPYLNAARSILRSPHALNGRGDTLSVDNYVYRVDVLVPKTDPDLSDAKDRRRVFQMIFDGHDQEPMTATVSHVKDIVYGAAQESKLYGAALMYELLKGGGVR